MSDVAPQGVAAGPSPLTAGTLVGSRFRIAQALRAEGGTQVYRAQDIGTGSDVILRIITVTGPARAALEADLGKALKATHKNLETLIAGGLHGDSIFLAVEAENAHTLRQLIDSKTQAAQTVGVAYAHTLLSHVAAGLEDGLQGGAHGALHPDCIRLTQAGRVKISMLGLGRAVPALARGGGPAGSPGGLYLAPEAARGAEPSPAADVYSMGAILFELLTGKQPMAPVLAPSKLRSEVSQTLDAVVARALSPSLQQRYAKPSEFIRALDAALHAPTPAPVATGAAAPMTRNTLGRAFNVAAAAGGVSGEVARWLVQKEKLDFGPFSLEHVKGQLEQGVFNSQHLIVDMDSGRRMKIKDHPQLGEFALQCERKLESARRIQAEHATETVERKKSRATLFVTGAVVIALGAGLVFFLMNRQSAKQGELAVRTGEADVDEFLKNVKIGFTQHKRPAAKRGGPGGGSSAGGGGAKDEFSNDMNMGDVTKGGGDDVLSEDTIQRVMMGNYRKLVPCIMEERKKNAGLSNMDLDFVVAATGKVSAVKVNGQRGGGFPACVFGRMQSFAFPAFNGRKTIASWSMSMQ